MAKKLIPKRKLDTRREEWDENRYSLEDYQITHVFEIIDGGLTSADFLNGIFSHRLGIPVGTDMYG